jgi:replicative DNA helicase
VSKPEIYYKHIDKLHVDLFTTALHRKFYTLAVELIMSQGTISPVQLRHRFDDVKDEFGNKLDDNYADIINAYSNVGVMNFKHNITTLQDLFLRREVSKVCNDALIDVPSDAPIDEILSTTLANMTNLLTKGKSKTASTFKEAANLLCEEMMKETPQYQATTGLTMLDVAMGGGIEKKRVYAFLAPPKCGKTLMATTISNQLASDNHKHLFICAEMGSDELIKRQLGQRLNLPSKAFYTKGSQRDSIVSRVIEETKKIQENIIFEDQAGITFESLQASVEKYVHQSKIEGFILDYYQLVGGVKRGQNKAEHLEDVANWVHRICKRHDIWCVLLVQANYDGKVLGSGGLARACDQLYMIKRPLDNEDIPVGNTAWLKLQYSRYTERVPLGDENNPILTINKNGTHFEEI